MSMEHPDEGNSSENVNCSITKEFYSPTIRLTLTLKEPDEESCSVFNYKSLIAEEKRNRRREKEKSHVNGVSEGNEEEDEEVKRLAQHFMEKYEGTNNTKKKKKKKAPTFYNYSELGWGYDESDSFIDNSEFDEALPDEMETLHGGYYVNVGHLDFKEVKILDDNSDDEIKVGKKKNGILKSDDSDSDEEIVKSDYEGPMTDVEEDPTSKKLPEENEPMQIENEPIKQNISAINVKTAASGEVKLNGETVKKKKYKKRHLPDDDVSTEIPKTKKKAVTVKIMLEEKRVVENGHPTNNLNIKTNENVSNSINDVIESVISMARNHSDDSRDSTSLSSDTKSIDSRTSEEIEKESHPEDMDVVEGATNNITAEKTEQIKLPDNLSSDVLELISQIKNVAQSAETGARALFKSPSFNSKLFKLEVQVKSLKSAGRHAVYEYVASFLPCSKDTLMKRAKKLLIEEEEKHTVEPYTKLKDSVERLMNSILEKYTSMCQQVADEKNVGELKNSDADEKENILSKMPPKKFIWTEECRSYLRELVSCRLNCFQVIKPRKESAEEYVRKYLDTKVKPIWPSGWIDTSILMKESHFNVLTSKVRKNGSPTTASLNSNQTATITTAPSISTKKSYSSVPSVSGLSTTSLSDLSFLQNTIALQTLAMQFPAQSDATAASGSIPYRPDLNLITANLPSNPSLAMDVLCRMGLNDTQFGQTKSSSPPKIPTSPSPSSVSSTSSTSTAASYPLQRSATPVISSNSLEKKKSADASSSRLNDLFKIDALINSSKSKKEHHMLNHVSQYNKHYSHKTEKRKNVHKEKSDINVHTKTVHQHNHAKANSSYRSKTPTNESSKSTGKIQILDLSPVKNKIDLSYQPQVDHKISKAELNPIIPVTVAAEYSLWSSAVKKEDCQLKRVEPLSKVPLSSPEVHIFSVSTSKPTHISRKQRLLQESSKNIGTDGSVSSETTNSKQSVSDPRDISRAATFQKFAATNSSKERDSYCISKLIGEVGSITTIPSGEPLYSEEPAAASDLINKIIDDTYRKPSLKASAVLIPKFERCKVEPDERVISPSNLVESKIRPSSRDSSHSSTSSLNTGRRTPNSDRVDNGSGIKDLLAFNNSISKRMELDSKKSSVSSLNDLNCGNHSSLLTSDEKATTFPKMAVTSFQKEFYKQINLNKSAINDSSYNNNGTNESNSQNCFTSELPSFEIEQSYPYQQSVIMPPTSSRWYSPESKS